MKVRAAVLSRMGAPTPYAASKPLSISEVDLDPPGPGEVLVKIAAAGLCHSDLSVIDGNRPRPMPMALCQPGAVANNAGTLLSGARRIHCDGAEVNHHLGCSAFAECATVSRRSLVKIDRELPLDEAALFGCAVMTGVGAVINTAKVSAGSSVAVIGLGGVGLSSLLGAVAVGARRVVAIDLSDDKLGLARQLGA